jgi:hypothetical protein
VRTITMIAASGSRRTRSGRWMLLLVVAALALTLSTTPSASATTTTRPQPGPVQIVGSPDQRVGCYVAIAKPFFLTARSRDMYAEGKFYACTKPPPEACKMEVELFSVDVVLRPLKSAWTGGGKAARWVRCKTLTVATEPYLCDVTPEKFEFYTQVAAQVEIAGKYYSKAEDSPRVSYYCKP